MFLILLVGTHVLTYKCNAYFTGSLQFELFPFPECDEDRDLLAVFVLLVKDAVEVVWMSTLVYVCVFSFLKAYTKLLCR